MEQLRCYSELKSKSKIINWALSTLDPKIRAAICYRFGIGGHRPLKYNEIAKVMAFHTYYYRESYTMAAARMWVLDGLKILQRTNRIKYLKPLFEKYKEQERDRRYATRKDITSESVMNDYHGYAEYE